MTKLIDLKKIFTEASDVILQAFESNDTQAGTEASPAQLIEVINQFFNIYEKLGHSHSNLINKDSVSQIGEKTINYLIELSAWAKRLNLDQESAMLDEIALEVAHWVIRHQGEILSLDAVVNILAAKANSTADKEILSSLFHVISDVMEHAPAAVKNDADKSDPNRPWRMLNFNFAIVATRTMNKDLMVRAFNTLGRNMPTDCPGFFEEGLKQSEKQIYGPEIKIIMAEYFKKWATLH